MKKKMNVRLLRRIGRYILAEPKRVDMSIFLIHKNTSTDIVYTFPKCNTVGCIAGWACALNELYPERVSEIEARAAELLGLDAEQANRLFYSNPGGTPQTKRYAQGVVRIIEKFIEAEK